MKWAENVSKKQSQYYMDEITWSGSFGEIPPNYSYAFFHERGQKTGLMYVVKPNGYVVWVRILNAEDVVELDPEAYEMLTNSADMVYMKKAPVCARPDNNYLC